MLACRSAAAGRTWVGDRPRHTQGEMGPTLPRLEEGGRCFYERRLGRRGAVRRERCAVERDLDVRQRPTRLRAQPLDTIYRLAEFARDDLAGGEAGAASARLHVPERESHPGPRFTSVGEAQGSSLTSSS